jgi:hypothetical protein
VCVTNQNTTSTNQPVEGDDTREGLKRGREAGNGQGGAGSGPPTPPSKESPENFRSRRFDSFRNSSLRGGINAHPTQRIRLSVERPPDKAREPDPLHPRRRIDNEMVSMPRPADPNSQRATAEFFGLKPDRFCRLLQRHGIDYQDRAAVAQMLKRSTSMSPATRRTVEEVLKATTPDTASKAPVTALEQLETMASNSPPKASTVEDAEGFLETLKRSLTIAESTSEELRSIGQYEDSRRWLALHSQLAKQFGPLSRQIMALKVEAKDLVSCAEAQLTFTAWIKTMRGRLETMPAAMAVKTNPADPEFSQTALEAWVTGFFKWLHSAPDLTQ